MFRQLISSVLLSALFVSTTSQTAFALPGNKLKGGNFAVRSQRSNSEGEKHATAKSFNLPITFEANRGQINDSNVNFIARTGGYSLLLEPTQAVFVFSGKTKQLQPWQNSSMLRMKLLGANDRARIEANGLERQAGTVNYLSGNESQKWQTDIETYNRVQYRNVYRGVDLLYYGKPSAQHEQQQLEYDFVVQPRADYKQIKLRFDGARQVEIERGSGDLLLHTVAGVLRQHRPVVYQHSEKDEGGDSEQQVETVEGRYIKLSKNEIGFELGKYDKTRQLIIDPVLAFSSYLGGSNSDSGNGIAVDAAGNTYLLGSTSSTNFPTVNPLQPTLGGCYDLFVTKINSSGQLVYSTYLGGSGCDLGYGIAVDSAGNAYVTGETDSTDFPTLNALQPAFGGGDYDAFVTKINSSGQLIYSTYLGGDEDDHGYGIAFDSTGNAYVTGATSSSDFPTINALQPANGGGFADMFVTKINSSGQQFLYSTYLGRSGTDGGYQIAVDSAGNALIAGFTTSTNFPTVNPLQPVNGGGRDVIITRLNPSGQQITYSTYLGGNDSDIIIGMAVDLAGNIYVTGYTYSTNFPTSNAIQPTLRGESDIFVSKINPSGQQFIYSTYLGGSGAESGGSIAVDGAGNSYITGDTASTDFPLSNAIQPTYNGGVKDAFLTKINSNGQQFVYSTYLGGSDEDSGSGIAVDVKGNADVIGFTTSANFPTKNPLQPTYGGGDGDAFIAKITNSATNFDFDGDQKADISVFRPSDGTWYRLNSGSGNSFSAWQFGIAEDKIAPADYDGDGKTDLAVFRPSSGVWYLLQSASGISIKAFGQTGDIPAPADYDGDGKADIAVFRPSTGVWYVLRSAGGVSTVGFGQSGDVPQVGDFDGDGKADISLYRPSNGVWYRLNSSNNQFVAQTFGTSGDVPDAADFDGDGKTDLAVFRPSSGVWYLQQSTNGFAAAQFGQSGDRPAAADFDGDGKADIAMFRPSTGVWYLNRSTDGFTALQFGQAGDVSIESAFVSP